MSYDFKVLDSILREEVTGIEILRYMARSRATHFSFEYCTGGEPPRNGKDDGTIVLDSSPFVVRNVLSLLEHQGIIVRDDRTYRFSQETGEPDGEFRESLRAYLRKVSGSTCR